MKTTTIILSFFALLLVFSTCASTPVVVPEGLAPLEYFQKGQEASSKGKYDDALIYYSTFIERFPKDIQRKVEAEYEIAFIAYKKKEFKKARKLFSAILDEYTPEASQILPAWPKVLSQKILDEMEKGN